MSIPNEELDRVLQTMALELLLVDMLVSRYLASPDPLTTAREHRAHIQSVLSTVAFPYAANPAESELVVGGLGDKIDTLLENAGQMVARRMDERRRS
jgi:hypothetical protein